MRPQSAPLRTTRPCAAYLHWFPTHPGTRRDHRQILCRTRKECSPGRYAASACRYRFGDRYNSQTILGSVHCSWFGTCVLYRFRRPSLEPQKHRGPGRPYLQRQGVRVSSPNRPARLLHRNQSTGSRSGDPPELGRSRRMSEKAKLRQRGLEPGRDPTRCWRNQTGRY